MSNILLIYIISLVIILYIYNKTQYDTKYIHSDKYNKNFYIKDNMDNVMTDKSIEYLNNLSIKIDKLVSFMYKESLPNAQVASRLYYGWSNCKLGEIEQNSQSIAYTLNKNSEIRLCIRKSETELENENTSIFVLLHELSHMASSSVGHGEEFKQNFSYITHLASFLGIYTPENFNISPKSYCGFEINSTPCSYGTCVVGRKKI